MFQGKTKAAVRLLSEEESGGPLCLDDRVDNHKTVRDILIEKHPKSLPVYSQCIIDNPPDSVHPVLFEAIDATLIKTMALRVNGSAGPSGLDATHWKKLCTSFKSASTDLCHSLALCARRLCTEYIDPCVTAPLLTSRLIALDKKPGVRPIGVGDTARRIIAKAILTVTRSDIQDAAGSMQLCAGQIASIEAGIHAVRPVSMMMKLKQSCS